MKTFKLAVPLCLVLVAFSVKKATLPADSFCGIKNIAFQVNEEVTFKVFYAVAGIYVDAGNATFTSKLERVNNRPVYHITGEGKTNSSYNLIYKVHDKYETFIDTATMQPLKFLRNVNEGGHKIYQNYSFNKTTNTVVTQNGVFKVPACVQDVVSAMYYARNVDFSKLRPDDKIPFSMFLDNEVYNMYIRYVGKEEVKTRYGKFRAIKIKPLLLKGEIFDGGEQMTVWVSDDLNRIPLRVESPLVVGKVKIDMMSHANLRHPLTSLIKRK
ncbi:MAG: hypothetical protein RIR12_1720 [Bacteroidota bacterium]|jgi:hypothetical protein